MAHRYGSQADIDARLTEKPNRVLLRIYNAYRLVIGLFLVLIASSGWHGVLSQAGNHHWFLAAGWLYLLANSLFALLPAAGRLLQVLALALMDVLLLCLLCYAAGHIGSIGPFLLLSVGIANILLRGRIGLFVAAVAALGLLVVLSYLSLTAEVSAQSIFQGGILGALCFVAALFSQLLAKRLHHVSTLAEQRASDVVRLEALNAHILQRMHTGILLLDEQRKILLANAESERLLGKSALAGCIIDTVCPQLVQCLQQWQQNPSLPPSSVRLEADGPLLQPGFMPLHYSGKQHSLIFLEDLAKVAQQAQQIKLAALGRLSAAIAHEIRNPLSAISYSAHLLREGEDRHWQAGDLRFVEIICQQSERLNQVVENVLQLSRPRALQGAPCLLELDDWLQRFVCEYRLHHLAQDQRLHFRRIGREPLQTRMEPSQLQQVLANLLQNALRYSTRAHPGNGQVWLELYRKSEDGQPILDVLDDGSGVPESEVAYLFEPFHSTESKGTGLGLYVSRELCELNRARLDYLPRAGGGSCLRITFAYAHSLSQNNA